MSRRLRSLLFAVAFTLAAPRAAHAQDAEGNPPAAFDEYWMVFLMRGENPPQLSEADGQALQREHLEHLGQLWRSGDAKVAGPFGGGPDDPMRGIVLLRGDLSEAEARALAEADPAVKAGRLRVDIRRWYTGAGMLTFQAAPTEGAGKKAKKRQ